MPAPPGGGIRNVSRNPGPGVVEIDVADTGVGLGLGLGLAISKAITKAHEAF